MLQPIGSAIFQELHHPELYSTILQKAHVLKRVQVATVVLKQLVFKRRKAMRYLGNQHGFNPQVFML